jgi:hypothetical protein
MASEFKKDVLSPGNGKDHPEPGDEVTIEYTGWLHEAGKPDNKGKQSGLPQQLRSTLPSKTDSCFIGSTPLSVVVISKPS